jgi:hypothetical protein
MVWSGKLDNLPRYCTIPGKLNVQLRDLHARSGDFEMSKDRCNGCDQAIDPGTACQNPKPGCPNYDATQQQKSANTWALVFKDNDEDFDLDRDHVAITGYN